MIKKEDEAEIRRLFHAEGWKIGTIARQRGHHHTTVRRVLSQSGVEEAKRGERRSMVEPYLPLILETLEEYPKLPASRLYEMVRRRGYPGGPDHFRHLVALHRPRPPAEAYLRLRTLPGEQAQVDWGHFGKLSIGRAEHPLMAFVMVLSWSRQIFVRFFAGSQMPSFLRGHVAAFAAWGGVPRVLLYDNLKSAVLERRGEVIRYHPTLVSFSGHYCFDPRPVAIARGNEKGRVERAIRYLRSSFFAAREWRDLEDLNVQVAQWCQGPAADRHWPQDRTRTVGEAFAEERERLLPLPAQAFPTEERQEARVGKTPYVRFDGNDYSVPHTLVRRALTVVADAEVVRVVDARQEVARHARSYSRGELIEEPSHVQALVRAKREARRHRGLDRLAHAVPSSSRLFDELARRGKTMARCTRELQELLDTYGAGELESAVAEALGKGSPHLNAVCLVLERRRARRGAPPRLPLRLDERAREITVVPHRLGSYDELDPMQEDDDEQE